MHGARFAALCAAVVVLCVQLGAATANVASGSASLPSFAASPRTDAELVAAFKQDGYDVQTIHRLNTGQRGIIAVSTNVTLLSTGQPKVVYYLEGSGYQMGYLHGLLAENSTSVRRTRHLACRCVPPVAVTPAVPGCSAHRSA